MIGKNEWIKKIIKDNNDVYNFLSNYHTLGNFIPVPIGFNGARSGYGKHDYWDLTLVEIKKWYEVYESDKKLADEIINKLLHNKVKYKHNCELWLKHFNTWEEFVRRNYLDGSFVQNNEVVMFTESHSWDNEIKELDSFYKNVNNFIKIRTNKMLDELRR